MGELVHECFPERLRMWTARMEKKLKKKREYEMEWNRHEKEVSTAYHYLFKM